MSVAGSKRLHLEQLEGKHLLDASLRINEFMADNVGTLKDADGDYSDWIELRNDADTPIRLNGWSLTDDDGDLRKWTFPPIDIPAGGFQLVFASGKERVDPASELHTSFRLSADGEYLALVDPAGTIVHQFAPAYPEQRPDISYGSPVDAQPLVNASDPFMFHVPTSADAALGLTWTERDFNDSAWTNAQGTLGYDLRPILPNVGFEANDLSNWDVLGNVFVDTDEFGVVPAEGSHQAVISNENADFTRFGAERFLGLDRFALNGISQGRIVRTSTIRRTFVARAGDEITLDWNFLSDDNVRNDFAFVVIEPGPGVIRLAGSNDAQESSESDLRKETGYRRFEHRFAEDGVFTLGLGVVQVARNAGESVLLVDNVTVGGLGGLGSSYDRITDTDLKLVLPTKNSSIWLRREFDISDPASVDALSLDVRYDDGFAAFLNGLPIAASNAPDSVQWNSRSTSPRPLRNALQFETFVIPVDESTLTVGKNILSVQGLNSDRSDNDFLLTTELRALSRPAEQAEFFTTPTPGTPNISDHFTFVSDIQFSAERGLYDEPFTLTLSTATEDATIWYTTNGSVPSEDNGIRYVGPIPVDSTTVVRARAQKGTSVSRRVSTHSYIFIEDVAKQSDADAVAVGLPSFWRRDDFTGFPVPGDYEMDQRVVGPGGTDAYDGVYSATVRDGLKALPTLSLVMESDDLFGQQGIYSNPEGRGVEWERPVSAEFVLPDGQEEGFQIDAGIRIQGGISRQIADKQSFRLAFRREYGETKLEYPLFGENAASVFDSVTLRSSSGEHVAPGVHYIRDAFMRRSQIATGNPGSHGRFVHLYINGMYWGVYNAVERIDAQFGANYFGGSKDDYDVLDAGTVLDQRLSIVNGSDESWNTLVDFSRAVGRATSQQAKTEAFYRLLGKNPDGSDNPTLEAYLDVDNFIDYLIVNLYGDNLDWPIRNYFMIRRQGPESTGFKFVVWDGEFTLDQGNLTLEGFRRRVTELSTGLDITQGPAVILGPLLTSEEFRIQFSDRVQKHFSPGGAFYVDPENSVWNPEFPENSVPAARYAALADEVQQALVPESARWGDERGHAFRELFPAPFFVFTVNEFWRPVVDANLTDFLPNRSAEFLAELREDNVYRDAPTFEPMGGRVDGETTVNVQISAGTIYYTRDGSDPRVPDGSVASGAIEFTEPITIRGRTLIRARALSDDGWTAIDEATYLVDVVPADPTNVRITEINFNPHDPLTQFGEMDVDNDEFEFIELTNIGSELIDLTGVRFIRTLDDGVEFTFGQQFLDPGTSVVVPENSMAFTSRYGDSINLALGVAPNQSTYAGRLSNQGETIQLVDAQGQTIHLFTYDDSSQWPGRADGDASSLEVLHVQGDYNNPANWRSSSEFGGSPGRLGLGPDNRVVINEVLANSDPPNVDVIELYNTTAAAINVGNWYLSGSSNDYFKSQIPSSTVLGADEYLVFDEGQLSFALNSVHGDEVFLIEADEQGKPLRFVDAVEFGPTATRVTIGRWPNGIGRLVPMIQNSLGSPNAGPLIGEVVISEIVYEPPDQNGAGIGRPDDFEFIELYNRSSTLIDVSGWRLEGDVGYQFPAGSVVAADAAVVLVGFDPMSEPEKSAAFRTAYQLDQATPLTGPYTGQLDDAAGTVRLTRSDGPPLAELGDQPPYVFVDEVRYASTPPWPSGLAESNQSLSRVSADAFGSFPSSWLGGSPTPGTADFVTEEVNGNGQIDEPDITGNESGPV